jgi:hypothetical protein
MTTYSAGRDDDSGPLRHRPRDWQDLDIGPLAVPPGPAADAEPGDPTDDDSHAGRPLRPDAASARRDRDPESDPARYAYVAPLVGILVTVPVLVLSFLYLVGGAMSTGACSPNGCQALNRALDSAMWLDAVALGALLTSWVMPRQLSAARSVIGCLALLLAFVALMLYATLPGPS